MSFWRGGGPALLLALTACAVPAKQTHTLADIPAAGTARLGPGCTVWLATVEDRRTQAQRESWHGAQRVELEGVTDGVRQTLRAAHVPETGAADEALFIEVVNAYLDTVAGMRSFNLVLRVTHADGQQWVARGRSVNVPWTSSAASVRQSLEDALADARHQVVKGLQGRCER